MNCHSLKLSSPQRGNGMRLSMVYALNESVQKLLDGQQSCETLSSEHDTAIALKNLWGPWWFPAQGQASQLPSVEREGCAPGLHTFGENLLVTDSCQGRENYSFFVHWTIGRFLLLFDPTSIMYGLHQPNLVSYQKHKRHKIGSRK